MTAETPEVPARPRLHRLERIFVRSPLYFVTTCTSRRQNILATTAVHESFVQFAGEGPTHGAWIGAYVLMPDHLHVSWHSKMKKSAERSG
jgi:REP element-mobilizing transposase RayT